MMAEGTFLDSYIKIGEKRTLKSDILGEERPYWIYLPPSYDNTTYLPQRYSVLVLLDGDAHFHVTAGIVGSLSETGNGDLQMPECIVIAILNTDRTRDLTPTHSMVGPDGEEDPWLKTSGAGDAFLQFLNDELFPDIEARYRTLPYRLIIGHSFGGLLALQALFDFPGLFQAYIVIDPSLWWDDGWSVRAAERMSEHGQALKGRVYVSFASSAESGMADTAALDETKQTLIDVMKRHVTSGFWFDAQNFESENHGTVVLPSLYDGLKAIFNGYRPRVNETIERPSSLTGHFERLSSQLGITLQPPADFVSMVGSVLLHYKNEPDKAIEAYNLNIANYPDSPQVYADIADAYDHIGEKALAIKNYQRSLALNPASSSVQKKLEELTDGKEDSESP